MDIRFGLLALALMAVAGCSQPALPLVTSALAAPPTGVVRLAQSNDLHFAARPITVAQGLVSDLYEPTMASSDTGVLYVAGHVSGAVSTGTPAYVSRDDGATWAQLPFANAASLPPPAQGSAPPQGDEGYIVTGPQGHAWMVDVKLDGYPVTGWCGDGAQECYHNPDAYDRAASASQACSQQSLNDRPWAAYANGTLLMSNNPGNGEVQIGTLTVPPALPVGATTSHWNMCAAQGDFIPGIPALRRDGRFAVPIFQNAHLAVASGNIADLTQVKTTTIAPVKDVAPAFGGGANFGSSAFDGAGTLWVAAMANTNHDGRFVLGASTNGGATFGNATFVVSRPLGFLNVAANANRTGVLVTWAQENATAGNADFYAARFHVQGGVPVQDDVSLVAPGVVKPCGDVMGSTLGPDGRAYVVVFSSPQGCTDQPLSTPLTVWVQRKA
ncbi:MAG: hypothetical protein ACYDBQ_04540 [Thermoplasmatota archaeon]